MDLTTLKQDVANATTWLSNEVATLGGDLSAGVHTVEEVGPALVAGAKAVISLLQVIGCFKSAVAKTDLATAFEAVNTVAAGIDALKTSGQ